MKTNHTNRQKKSESGVALLIAIFVLMLISVIAISLIVASGSESTLAGNYRSSSAAYLAGTAGLEEARGRLLQKNADYFNKAPNNTPATNFIPTAGPLAIGQVRYILNPAQGEALATLLATYPDNEYATEFGAAPVAANVKTIASVSTVTSGGTTYYGPLFKWVRIRIILLLSTTTRRTCPSQASLFLRWWEAYRTLLPFPTPGKHWKLPPWRF